MKRRWCISMALLAVFAVSAFAKDPPPRPEPLIERTRPAGMSDARRALYRAASLDTTVLAFWDFNDFGACDAQGWTSADLGEQRIYFHVDDFLGLGGGSYGRLMPLEGNQSMWCGARPDPNDPELCQYAALPGYGNGWNQSLRTVACLAVTGDVAVSYRISWDVETGEDYGWLRYDLCEELMWPPTVRSFTGRGTATETTIIPDSLHNGQLRVAFNVTTDGAWSDADGMWDTDGAMIVDSVTVSDDTGVILPTELFEDEAVGDTITVSGHWRATTITGYGDFAGMFGGMAVVQEDPCRSNLTCLWGFFNGSTADYACAGFPHQAAVPYQNAFRFYLDNEIRSPLVPFTGSGAGVELAFDVYKDMPLDALVFYTWSVRSVVSGCPTPWEDRNFVYWGAEKQWVRDVFAVGDLVDPAATHIQVVLSAVDMCMFWCGIYGSGSCHSHSPLFDNVEVRRIDTNGPLWTVNSARLFQDNFAGDGTTTGTVRIDIAQDLLRNDNPNVRPGDSLSVQVSEPAVGLDYHLPGDPESGPAVYLHVKDVSPAKSGDAVSGDVLAWPVVRMADGWTVLRFDVADSYFDVDLNDNLYTPGDTVWYYFSARDANGNANYFSSATGVTDSPTDVIARPMEMTCLPANAIGGGTDILYVDDCDGHGAEPLFMSAFEILGLTPDRYDVLAPTGFHGNSPGRRVVDPFVQLAGYRKIIWSTGDLDAGLIGDGIGPEKADDFGLLMTFLDDFARPGLYLSGDNLAEEWNSLSGAGAVGVRNNYMQFNFVDGGHTNAGASVSPLVMAGPGATCLAGDTLIAFGGCPYLGDFDVITPFGRANLEMSYENNPSLGAVLSQATQNIAGDTARVVLSGFSFHMIRDEQVQSPTDRTEHLLAVLRWLGNDVPDPTRARPSPDRNWLAQNYPNPFNPTTAIHFTVRERQHVSLRVYDVTGKLVRTLVDDVRVPGVTHDARWDGTDNRGAPVASGVFFYKLVTRDYTQAKKMVLMK